MNNPKVSIIIPIYKVEKYIKQCVDSCLHQTYRNLQIILVDDGSPDSCGSICDAYAEADPRVLVIHKSNGGLSDARNAGIRMADGDFVLYLDSDDYLEEDAVACLMGTQEETGADLVMGNYWYTYTDHEDLAAGPCSDLNNPAGPTSTGTDSSAIKIFDNHSAMEGLMTGRLQTFAWGKLMRASLAKRYEFPVGKLFEDHFWTHRIFGDADRIVFMKKGILHYRQREDSISFTFSISRLDVLEGWKERLSFVEEKYPDLRRHFLHNCAGQYVNIAWLIQSRMKEQKSEAFKRMRELNQHFHLEEYAAGQERALIMALDHSDGSYARKAYLYKIKGKIGL